MCKFELKELRFFALRDEAVPGRYRVLCIAWHMLPALNADLGKDRVGIGHMLFFKTAGSCSNQHIFLSRRCRAAESPVYVAM